jgi:replicative DNA helicase
MDLTNINKDKDRKNRRKAPLDLSTMVYGKVPPQAKDLEEAVLGAIMLERNAFDIASEILQPESFYVDAHQRIFTAMRSLSAKSQPIDTLTVTEQLRFSEELDMVGGPYYINRLTTNIVSSAHIEAHCKIIMQKFLQREIIRIGGEMVTDAYEDSTDVFDLLDTVENNVYSITVNNLKKDFNSIDVGLVKAVQRIEHLRTLDTTLTGVPSGFQDLDAVTHGWQATDLIILAARPSVGKTAFALNLARNAAMHPQKPTPVAFFSLEMSEGQLIQRMLSAESEIWLEKISTGKMEEHEMKQLYARGIQRLAQAPIFIDDSAGLNIFELRAKCRRLKAKHHVGLIIIDYLQLMTGDRDTKGNREQEISKISRELKKLAKDLEVPIIALSQLSREVEKRGKGQKVPQLSDLRESGAIEQDADMVMFLYRPPDDEVKEDPSLKGTGMLKIAKHRNGSLEDIFLKFLGAIQKWLGIKEADAMDRRPGPSFIPVNPNMYIEQGSKINNNDDEDLPF